MIGQIDDHFTHLGFFSLITIDANVNFLLDAQTNWTQTQFARSRDRYRNRAEYGTIKMDGVI